MRSQAAWMDTGLGLTWLLALGHSELYNHEAPRTGTGRIAAAGDRRARGHNLRQRPLRVQAHAQIGISSVPLDASFT